MAQAKYMQGKAGAYPSGINYGFKRFVVEAPI
jgi:hypothetical protein